MVADQMVWNERKTGNTRYRLSFFGKVILQVEVARRARSMNPYAQESSGGGYTYWRDATMADLRFDLDAMATPSSTTTQGKP